MSRTNEKTRFALNTGLNATAQVASTIAAFFFMPLLVKSFGLPLFGTYVLISAVVSYTALLDFGVGTALTRAVAETDATSKAPDEAITTATGFYLIVGVVAASVMALLAASASAVFHVTGHQAEALRTMLLIAAAFQLFLWPASTARNVLAGLQRYDVISLASFVSTAVIVAGTIWVIATGRGPVELVVVTNIAALVSATIVAWVALRTFVRVWAIRWRPSMQRLLQMLRFGWAAFVVQLSDVLFYQQTDRLILGVLAGSIAVGLYEASAKVNSLIIYLSGLTVSAVLPLASSMDEAERHASLRSLLLRGSKYGSALIAPVAVVIVALAEPLVVAWLGPRYIGQGVVMQVLVLPHVLICMGLMGDAIVISKGRMGPRVPFIVGQAILNVVLSVALVPKFGVIGVAVGTAVAHLVDFPIHMRFLFRETKVGLREWLREMVLPVYPLLIVPAAIAVAFVRYAHARSLLSLAVAAAVALAAYWIGFFLFGLPKWEREDLLAVGSSLIGRA